MMFAYEDKFLNLKFFDLIFVMISLFCWDYSRKNLQKRALQILK
jgi:hypothetical protein